MSVLELFGLGGNSQLSDLPTGFEPNDTDEDYVGIVEAPVIQRKKIICNLTGRNGVTFSFFATHQKHPKDSRYKVDEFSSKIATHSVVKGNVNIFDEEDHIEKNKALAYVVKRAREDPKLFFEVLKSMPPEMIIKFLISQGVDIHSFLPSPVIGDFVKLK